MIAPVADSLHHRSTVSGDWLRYLFPPSGLEKPQSVVNRGIGLLLCFASRVIGQEEKRYGLLIFPLLTGQAGEGIHHRMSQLERRRRPLGTISYLFEQVPEIRRRGTETQKAAKGERKKKRGGKRVQFHSRMGFARFHLARPRLSAGVLKVVGGGEQKRRGRAPTFARKLNETRDCDGKNVHS